MGYTHILEVNKLSESKLPQDLKLSDGRDVILSDELHEQLLTVAQCANTHMIMFADYELVGVYGTMNVDKLSVPKQTCSTISSNIEESEVDFTKNVIIVYMHELSAYICQSYMMLAQKYAKRANKPIMLITYNKVGDYKIMIDYQLSEFAKQLKDLVTVVDAYESTE